MPKTGDWEGELMSTPIKAKLWECVELAFAAGCDIDDPFRAVELGATFRGPGGAILHVPGYWEGDDRWVVRFAPTAAGLWHWESACFHPDAGAMHGCRGTVVAAAWTAAELADNPNRRGFVRVHAGGRYFEYADGTPFYWLGDTLWAGHAKRCDPESGMPRYLDDRKVKGFTVIQMVVGRPTADASGAVSTGYWSFALPDFLNEGGAPYMERFRLINPQYFRELDRRIRLMTERGFVPCLLAMWGQELKAMDPDDAQRYWRYVVARYGAYNVVWSLAGEFLFTFDVPAWRRLGEAVDRLDPYGHPTTAHSIAPHSGSRQFQGESWYDFNLAQVGHVLAFKNIVENLPVRDYAMTPIKPAIMGESWYENHPNTLTGITPKIDDEDVRFAAYVSLLQGFVGQTYGAHGIWSFYAGEPYDNWNNGMRPGLWTDELHLPGSMQMKYVRDAFETVAWWRLEPHPEWASSVRQRSTYCAGNVRDQYIVYCTAGAQPDSLLVMIDEAEGEPYEGRWMNPRTGEWSPAQGDYRRYGLGWIWFAVTPDERDWVLVLKRS